MEKKALLHTPASQRALFRHINPLKLHQLRKSINADEIPFETTDEINSDMASFHQPRAEKALELGIKLKNAGHVFVCGSPDMRPRAFIDAALKQYAKRHSEISDYLAVCPAEETWFPLWVRLPAGQGRTVLKEIENSINSCRERIRNQLLPRILRSKQPLDKTYQAAWIEELNDLLAARLHLLDQKCGEQRLVSYFNALKEALEKRMKKILDLAVQHVLQDSKGPEIQRIQEEADQFLSYCPILIHEAPLDDVPIVFEPNPTLSNLFGHVIQEGNRAHSHSSSLFLFHPGSLLNAQGGFLILNFEDVANEPDVWKNLKRCLRYKQLEFPLQEQTQGSSTSFLKPEMIPLGIKLIAWGDERTFQDFYDNDPVFAEIFKIRADLDDQMDLNAKNTQKYLAFLKQCCEKESLLPFHRTGAATFIEAGAELAGSQKKLTARQQILADLIREAAYLAEQEKAVAVQACHVEAAQKARKYRSNLPEEQVHELIQEGSILIQTEGAIIGQVNGLALYETEDYMFGKPCRITAQAGMGRSGVINIEREANLSGKIHDKGILILCGYLRDRFAQNKPLNLSISLCIEQFYSDIDGDSASLGEICAILSSLAKVPIQQGFAITGAISQKGEIQPVGCVNEKIVGFFDVCKPRGLTGRQGVVIPAGNVSDLMLPEKVIQAAKKGDFLIYAVQTVEQAIEILSGYDAGLPNPDGLYPPGTINYLIDDRLQELARGLRDFFGEGEEPEEDEDGPYSV